MAFGHPKNEKKAIFCFLSELRMEMHGQNGALSSRMVIRARVAGFLYPHCSKAIKVLTLMACGHPKNEKKAIFCFLSELRMEMHGQNGTLNWQGSPMFYHWMICRTRMARMQSVHNIPNGNYFYQQVVANVYA